MRALSIAFAVTVVLFGLAGATNKLVTAARTRFPKSVQHSGLARGAARLRLGCNRDANARVRHRCRTRPSTRRLFSMKYYGQLEGTAGKTAANKQ